MAAWRALMADNKSHPAFRQSARRRAIFRPKARSGASALSNQMMKRFPNEICPTNKGSRRDRLHPTLAARRSNSDSLNHLLAAWLQLGWQGRGKRLAGVSRLG